MPFFKKTVVSFMWPGMLDRVHPLRGARTLLWFFSRVMSTLGSSSTTLPLLTVLILVSPSTRRMWLVSRFARSDPRQGDLGVGIEDVRAGSSATAGESSGIIGLREVSDSDSSVHISRVSNSLNSYVGVVMSACASAACALPAAAAPRSWSTVARLSDAVVAHAHASPMHRARNSGGTGGLLPVQRSTSYCLRNSWSDTDRVQGPTGTRRVKRGVSGPAEDLRPVAEVAAGVNFRPAGGVPFPGGNQAQVPGVSGKVRSHLPSTRRFLVSNSCHLDTDYTVGNLGAKGKCQNSYS